MNSVGTSEDGEESSSVQDEEDSVHIITDILSSVQAPRVSLRNYKIKNTTDKSFIVTRLLC